MGAVCQCVIPRYLLKPIPKQRDLGVECKAETLRCIQGKSTKGMYFLHKECVRRAYQLVEKPTAPAATLDEGTLFVGRSDSSPNPTMEPLEDCLHYIEVVRAIRQSLEPGFVLLYHYTDPRFIDSISTLFRVKIFSGIPYHFKSLLIVSRETHTAHHHRRQHS